MSYDFVLTILPFLYLIAYSIKALGTRRPARTSLVMTIILALIAIIVMGLYPSDLSMDKPRYMTVYYRSLYEGFSAEFRDLGWIIYNALCSKIFGDNIDLFFLLTAVIYVSGFLIFSKTQFPKDNVGYFFVMSAGCLGFINYGTNVIRAGVAISLLLIAFSVKLKDLLKLLLVLIAISFQKSMIIPVFAYWGGRYIKKTWIAVLFWLLCLLISISSMDLGPLFESIGFVDERVEKYADTIDSFGGSYVQGFRIDFLLYSIAPLLIAGFYVLINKVYDSKYLLVLRSYLFANAIWLLVIRMAYTDRIAYLSWFMIPYIVLYPVIKYQHMFRKPQLMVLFVMALFMAVPALLLLRTINT